MSGQVGPILTPNSWPGKNIGDILLPCSAAPFKEGGPQLTRLCCLGFVRHTSLSQFTTPKLAHAPLVPLAESLLLLPGPESAGLANLQRSFPELSLIVF